jgi:hypothetical protein
MLPLAFAPQPSPLVLAQLSLPAASLTTTIGETDPANIPQVDIINTDLLHFPGTATVRSGIARCRLILPSVSRNTPALSSSQQSPTPSLLALRPLSLSAVYPTTTTGAAMDPPTARVPRLMAIFRLAPCLLLAATQPMGLSLLQQLGSMALWVWLQLWLA